MASGQDADEHHEVVDVTTSRRPKVLMVVANPTTSPHSGSSPMPEGTSASFRRKHVCENSDD
jgi:hypothetical protein